MTPCPAPPRQSGRLLVRVAPGDVALFRFLLEAYENLAFFSVLERKTALLKVVFSPQQEDAVRAALAEIGASLPLTVEEWPFPGQTD
ncbi:DUF4911 domain-containing protein [Desulfovibrio sp.]|uniref:DUF4911 domain-containing protein n=1 Tax=Desulfovibrio sp. TaxID=885 RepID=UPI0023BCFF7B|nr:DUF4911 domain-containing protein [Desulfovibrio sp.]MDE7241306.1 DUF4911 domain-containing protein [Desulfovibrio sp.]